MKTNTKIAGDNPFHPVNLAAGLVVNLASKILESKGQTLEDTRFGGFLKKIGIIAQNTNDTLRDAINETEKLFFQKHTEYHLSGYQLFFEHETTIAQIKNRLFNHEPFDQSQLEQTLKTCFGSTIRKLKERNIEVSAVIPNFFACFNEVLQKHKDNEVLLLLYGNLKQTEEILAALQAEGRRTRDELGAKIDEAVNRLIEEFLRHRTETEISYGSESARLITDLKGFTRSELPKKLIGRDDLLRQIKGHLDDSDHILLQGIGGIGKTALAATAASQWIQDGKGGVLWLRAGNADTDTLFIGLALTDDDRKAIAPAQGEARVQIVHQLLAKYAVSLVVVDNAWNGKALHSLLNTLPHKLPVLVTARQNFGVEIVIDKLDLTPDTATDLLYYHWGVSKSSDTVDAKALCQKLGYLAFAIEIAGRDLKTRKLTPLELLGEIENAPHDLKMPLSFAEEGRESVAQLLEVSLNALDETARKVFLAFGAFFVPTATPELLSIYLSDTVGTQAMPGSFNTLQDHGLAERIPETNESVTYYRIHDLAHTYAHAQNDESARGRAVDACLAYTERYNTPSLENFKALRPELNNFIEAAKWAFENERWEAVERFAWNLQGGSQILDYLGSHSQAITLFERAKDSAVRQGDKHKQNQYIGALGSTYLRLGSYHKAITHYQTALNISRDIQDWRLEGTALGNLGSAHLNLGDYHKAIEFCQAALNIAQEIGDKLGEGTALGNLGLAYLNLGEYDQAIEFYQAALTIQQAIDDKRGQGNQLGNLGLAYANLGEYDQALEHFQAALNIVQEIGDKHGQGNQLNNLGLAYANLGEYDQALEHFQAALNISRDIQDRRLEGIALGNLGSAHLNLGDYHKAIEFCQAALNIAQEIGDKLGEANRLNNIAVLHKTQGNYDLTLDSYRQARALFEKMGLAHMVARVDRNIADVEAARDKKGE